MTEFENINFDDINKIRKIAREIGFCEVERAYAEDKFILHSSCFIDIHFDKALIVGRSDGELKKLLVDKYVEALKIHGEMIKDRIYELSGVLFFNKEKK